MGNKSKTLGPYRIVQKLNHSAFGETYLAQKELQTGVFTTVVIKVQPVHKNDTIHTTQMHLLSRMEHPNLIQILDGFTLRKQRVTVFAYIAGWDLAQLLTLLPTLPSFMPSHAECFFLSVLHGVLSAIRYLHSQGLAYGDIHPTNIRITPHLETKLIDMGTLQKISDGNTASAIGMRPGWSPPEKAESFMEHASADFYTLAKLVAEMYTAYPMLSDMRSLNPIREAANICLTCPVSERTTTWNSITPIIHAQCAKAYASSGMSIVEILHHLWKTSAQSLTVPVPSFPQKRSVPKWAIWGGTLVGIAGTVFIVSRLFFAPVPQPPASLPIPSLATPTPSVQQVPLILQAKPWAQIWINDVFHGTTPLKIHIPANRFPLRVVARYQKSLQIHTLQPPLHFSPQKPIRLQISMVP